MFVVSGGFCSIVKYILFLWVVKVFIGNVKVIKFLSWLGYGILYLKFEEIEIVLCLKKIESEEEMVFILLLNVYFGVFIILVFDNIDWLEEIFSRGGIFN